MLKKLTRLKKAQKQALMLLRAIKLLITVNIKKDINME